MVIGDLHGNTDRLERILQEFGPRLAAGEISLLFLGDIIHPEGENNLRDMRSSLEALNTIIRLKQLFPDRVNLLLGNHDEIRPNDPNRLIIKHGVMQTMMFNDHLQQFFEDLGYSPQDISRVRAAYQSFFDGCPLAAIVEGSRGSSFLAHSAVIRGGVTQAELVNARTNGLMQQLIWNSHVARIGSSDKYTEADVIATIARLGLRGGPANTYLLSGHTPNMDAGWLYRPFNGLNHFILHSNVNNSFGVVILQDGVPAGRNVALDQAAAAGY
ncbi:MAG: metallophosphoesterase [Candidatus Saganbacteria bacterium]|nr:metallophosphoesterase [Candidatus Saganbacteria bacterium]